MQGGLEIRGLEEADLPEALRLVWQTFLEFEAPEYSAEGVREFERFIELKAMRAKLQRGEMLFWGCFEAREVVGLLAARAPCHISLLFVKKSHHRRGI
ncbi:MAG: GNAT family N-acetyltransferase, partial [Christensenellaceae bacterium]|nr:GNAT family N-acetyltransferase [Christensenellaceae bacterium]